jgi:hypothetical protein
MAGELVGGVLGAGARKVAPGARPPAVSRVVLTTSAAVAHNRGDQVAYVSPGELGTSPGLLARFLAWIRGGKA